jgi:hypothetical protein
MEQNKTSKSFFQHKRVWIITFVTLLLAFCIAGQIIVSDNLIYAKDFGKTDAKLFMDSFKLPIGIVAAGLSVLLLFATQHRSEQTAEQIKLTNEANKNSLTQNTLRNYYDSITDFEKYITESFHSEIIEIKNKRQLYKLFFPENSYQSVCPYTTTNIYKNNVKSFLELVKNNIETNKKDKENTLETFEGMINDFILMAKTRYGANIKINNDSGMRSIKRVSGKRHLPINDYILITDEVRKLLTFCLDYTPSNGIVVIVGSRVCDLGEWKDFINGNSEIKTMKYHHSRNEMIKLRLV